MNSQQLKYAKERLEKIYREKFNKIERFYGYDQDTRDRLFEDGEFGIVKQASGNYIIVWNGEDELKQQNTEKYNTLLKEYQSILDELMLGDQEIALSLIQNFSKD